MENWGPYRFVKAVYSSVPFAIAIWGNEKWLLAFGFFVMIFALITIADHLEAIRKTLIK